MKQVRVITAREYVGRTLRDIRLMRGYSLRELSGMTGISFQYLSKIERGVYSSSIDTIAVVALALGARIEIVE